MNERERLREAVGQAEMVLVGLGEEMDTDWRVLLRTQPYAAWMEQMEGQEAYDWVMPYLMAHYLRSHPDPERAEAYAALHRLLEGKNYFLISLCTDGRLREQNWKEDRVVLPCGGYAMLQCGCGTLTEAGSQVEAVAAQCAAYFSGSESAGESAARGMDAPGRLPLDSSDRLTRPQTADRPSRPQMSACPAQSDAAERTTQDGSQQKRPLLITPVCKTCNQTFVFNHILSPHYAESGYLPQWERYKKWLQGTVNRKLCILELGVGMRFPSVIRFPFEKIAYFNEKADFFRIHSKLYQMSEELSGRGVSVAQNPIDFLRN